MIGQWRINSSDVNKTHPIKGGVWIDVVVEVMCVATGERREREESMLYMPEEDGDTPSSSWWREGNGGCDCNRVLTFLRAANEPDDDDETPCGDGAYRVNLRNPVTGEVFYREFD